MCPPQNGNLYNITVTEEVFLVVEERFLATEEVFLVMEEVFLVMEESVSCHGGSVPCHGGKGSCHGGGVSCHGGSVSCCRGKGLFFLFIALRWMQNPIGGCCSLLKIPELARVFSEGYSVHGS